MIPLFTGVVLAVSANSWLISWLGLELNLLSFIPIMTSSTNIYSSESALKYFLVQALASTFVICSAVSMILVSAAPILLILAALLLKMGSAPLHFWLPPIMQGISWMECFILMTIQKLTPAILISYTTLSPGASFIIQVSSISSSIMGAIGGLNQTSLRKILAYSSISHIAWILAAVSINISVWLFYMLVYSLISLAIVYLFKTYQMTQLKQASLILSSKEKISFYLTLFSLGGLPPLMGFYPKMMVLTYLISNQHLFWLIFLLAGSLLTLFFYIRLTMSSLVVSSPNTKSTFLNKNHPKTFSSIMILNSLGIFFPFFLVLFY